MNGFTKYVIVILLMAGCLGFGFALGNCPLFGTRTWSDKMADIELVKWEYQTSPLVEDPVLLVYYKIKNTGKVDLKRCIMGILIEYNDEIVTDYDAKYQRHNIVEDFEVPLKPGKHHFNYTIIEDLSEDIPLISFGHSVVKNVQIDSWLIK